MISATECDISAITVKTDSHKTTVRPFRCFGGPCGLNYFFGHGNVVSPTMAPR